MHTRKRIGSYSILLLIILGLAFLFRFYRLSEWFSFGMDQEYEALLVKNILTGNHFPLIGVNASDTGIYLGPAFIYFAAILTAISGGNIFAWAIFSSFLGVIVTYLIYRIGQNMFHKRVGILAALFYGCSFLVSFYDRQFWNPMLIPLASLIIGYLLFEILNGKVGKIIWLSIIFSLALQSHLSVIIFLPFIIFVVLRKLKQIDKKLILYALALFMLFQTPLMLFDIRHGFTNTKAAVQLMMGRNRSVVNPPILGRITLFTSMLGRYFWVPAPADVFTESGQCLELTNFQRIAYPEGILIMIAGLGFFIWRYIRKWRGHTKRVFVERYIDRAQFVVFIVFLLAIIFVLLYTRQFFEYYFLFLFPWLAIALGFTMHLILQKEYGTLIIVPIAVTFISLNLFTLMTSYSSYSYSDKLRSLSYAKNFVGNGNYTLEALGECPRFGGYRYLFEYFIGTPISSYMDSYYSWLYRGKLENEIPKTTVLLSMIDDRMNSLLITKWQEIKFQYLAKYRIESQRQFGKIQVYILTLKN